jgi:hypothetical protein
MVFSLSRHNGSQKRQFKELPTWYASRGPSRRKSSGKEFAWTLYTVRPSEAAPTTGIPVDSICCRDLCFLALEEFDLFWVELDIPSAESVATIRQSVRHPIASCETLFGPREFLPFFEKQAVDMAIVDAVWNGVWQSTKVAHVADATDVNIALHNFYGHLSTMMNVHLAAATLNFAILETDIGGYTNW